MVDGVWCGIFDFRVQEEEIRSDVNDDFQKRGAGEETIEESPAELSSHTQK